MPGDPWRCYNHGTGVGRWSSRVLLDGTHPSLRVDIIRLLLLSHAWPRFASVFSLLYVTLPRHSSEQFQRFSPFLSVPPFTHPLLLSCSFPLFCSVFWHSLCYLVLFSNLLLCFSSSTAVISATLCHIQTCQARMGEFAFRFGLPKCFFILPAISFQSL